MNSISLRSLLKWEHLILGTDLLPKQRVSSILAGKHSSMMRGRGLDFEEVRNYVPGDDIRNIDWKVTARTKTTHSKVFNEEKERPALVVVDQSSYMRFGSQMYLKSVIAAEAAALAAFRTIKKGDRCGGMVFTDEATEWFAPKRSRQSILQLLKSVSKCNNELLERKTIQSNSSQLEKTLKRIASFVTHDFIISIITDFTQCTQAGYRMIKQMAQHNDVICVHIEDDLDNILDKKGTVITDGKKQIFWRKSPDKNIEAEQKKDSVFKEYLNSLQRKYKIPVLYLNTKHPLEQQIKNIFKSR